MSILKFIKERELINNTYNWQAECYLLEIFEFGLFLNMQILKSDVNYFNYCLP